MNHPFIVDSDNLPSADPAHERDGPTMTSTMAPPRPRGTRAGVDTPLKSIALIGDVVRSRRFPGPQRRQVQPRLEELTAALNQRHHPPIPPPFPLPLADHSPRDFNP